MQVVGFHRKAGHQEGVAVSIETINTRRSDYNDSHNRYSNGKPQKTTKKPENTNLRVCWETETPNEKSYMLRRPNVCMFDIIFEFDH